MRRVPVNATRPDWLELTQQQGLLYWYNELPDGTRVPYWTEGAHYEISDREVAALEQHATTLLEMCVAAGDHVVHHGLWDRFRIPEFAREGVARTWNADAPRLYGRFDLRYAGPGPQADADPSLLVPKLYEFNADTPTTLVEAAVIQWHWFTDLALGHDQWNGLHEHLVQAWRDELAPVVARLGYKPVIHLACSADERTGEDLMTVQYLRDTALEAGFPTRTVLMEEIVRKTYTVPVSSPTGLTAVEERSAFFDPQGQHIDVIFKLYPWEWMVEQEFGPDVFRDLAKPAADPYGPTVWIEPPYTMLWSTKALLPVLWQLYADDPVRRQLLLPSWFEDERPAGLRDYVRKPLFGREGSNITVVRDGRTVLETEGPYTDAPFVVQQLAELPEYPDAFGNPRHPLTTVWLVAGEPRGMGIRETAGIITDNVSTFVPHVITWDL